MQRTRFLKKHYLLIVSMICFIFPTVLKAELGASFSGGYVTGDGYHLRIGVQKPWKHIWCVNQYFRIAPHWELSANTMHKRLKIVGKDDQCIHAIALAFAMRMYRESRWGASFLPYLEIGVGLSMLDNTCYNDHNLGMHFQFEDRLSIGMRIGDKKQIDLGYRYMHFSNANLSQHNHGINMHSVYIGYWW